MSEEAYVWVDPNDPKSTFVMTIDGPSRSGWYSALVELNAGMGFEYLSKAESLLKEKGYYRPRDRWDGWSAHNTTYMRKNSTYHELKVRRRGDGDD